MKAQWQQQQQQQGSDRAIQSLDRCTSTERNCDGYVHTDKLRKPEFQELPMLVKQLPSISPSDLVKHGDALDLFNRRTAPRIGGFYDHTFWNRIVVQLATIEPPFAVQYTSWTACTSRLSSRRETTFPIWTLSPYSHTPQQYSILSMTKGPQKTALIYPWLCAHCSYA